MKDRDHLCLILEVKDTSGTTQKGSSGSEKGGTLAHTTSCELPRDLCANIHPEDRALGQARARRRKMIGQRNPEGLQR